MGRYFKFDVDVKYDDGGEEYRHLRIVGEMSPWIPAQGPTYSCGGQPAEGGEVEDYKIFEDGKEIEDTDGEILEAVLDEVYEKVQEEMSSAKYEAAEHRRESMEDR